MFLEINTESYVYNNLNCPILYIKKKSSQRTTCFIFNNSNIFNLNAFWINIQTFSELVDLATI